MIGVADKPKNAEIKMTLRTKMSECNKVYCGHLISRVKESGNTSNGYCFHKDYKKRSGFLGEVLTASLKKKGFTRHSGSICPKTGGK